MFLYLPKLKENLPLKVDVLVSIKPDPFIVPSTLSKSLFCKDNSNSLRGKLFAFHL